MARRAASISRAVMRQRSVAFRPYSPNATELPRCALPEILPLNCLRNLVRFGCIMLYYLSSTRSRRRSFGGLGAARYCRFSLALWGFLGRLIEHLALEYPNLDADHAVRGLRLCQTVVDVGAKGVQRNPPFAIGFGTGDLRTVQPAGNAHFDSQCAGTHGVGHGALHGAAKHHALFQLLRNALGDQFGVQLGLSDLGNVEPNVVHRHAENFGHRGTKFLDVLALLADHDSRPS